MSAWCEQPVARRLRVDSSDSSTSGPTAVDTDSVDFEEAQALWSDPALLEIPARVSDEPRWVVVGKMNEKHWSAVITRRGENVRLISVRRSRDEEVEIYENQDI